MRILSEAAAVFLSALVVLSVGADQEAVTAIDDLSPTPPTWGANDCLVPTEAPVEFLDPYVFHVDCYMEDTNYTATQDTLEVKFYDGGGEIMAETYFHGLECPEDGSGQAVALLADTPPKEIRIGMYGFDAALINRAWLSLGGTNLTFWGFDDLQQDGWCLSRDEDDAIKNSWFGRVKAVEGNRGCLGCLSFQTFNEGVGLNVVGLCGDYDTEIET